LIQRNFRFSNRTQSSIFPNSLFTCQRTAAAHQRRRCFMHHLLFSVNNFFQSFFRKALQHFAPPCPSGLSQCRCASARSSLCLKHQALSNTFFEFFEKILKNVYSTLILLIKY